jgi:two-component system, cell cycle sensor histidine kinase and response regulator CckA
MAVQLRVLIVEDSEDDAELLLRELRRSGFEPVFQRVDTQAAMRSALEQLWDVVVSDWGMPHFSATHALGLLQELGRDLPFIIVSGTVGEEAAVAALRAGAHDFMAKGRLTRLIPAIEREMREAAGRAERRVIEQQLRRTQRMEAMGQLTGGIAHDFNNLLGVIVGNGGLLLEAVEGNAEQVELANEILNSAQRGAELTHRLLAFARQQPLAAETVDINARLPPIVAMLRRTLGESIDIASSPAGALWATRVDASQFENALLNLAINARDAMSGGGTLTIETANAQLDTDYASLHSEVVPGDYVMLAMTDTGTGMPPEVMERAMEPFFTTKEMGKGTGLGLSMVYGFAKQSGGHLNIYSELGVGTTIRLYLPRAQGGADTGKPVAATTAKAPVAANEAILLVDDNAALRRVTVRQLAALGYRVHDADSGPAALAIIDSGAQFDLLFTDIGLPGGMNGVKLAEEARRRLPRLKVLFTTGYGNVGGQNGDAAGQLGPLLRKPYTGDELAGKLRKALAAELPADPAE